MQREEYLTVEEARLQLRVSKWKMAELIKSGTFQWRPDPLDRRVKLIRRAEVDTYLEGVPRLPEERGKKSAA